MLKNFYYKRLRRGFGYRKWKSYLVNAYFIQLQENDILVYSDTRNYWNIKWNKQIYIKINICT